MFSIGLLYRTQQFLDYIDNYALKSDEFKISFPLYYQIKSKDILNISQNCAWVTLDIDGIIKLTDSGKIITDEKNIQNKLRLQLKDILKYIPPQWAPLLIRGRGYFTRYVNPDIIQCFMEAGLLNGNDESIVSWWDEIGSLFKQTEDANKLRIGRVGERLSIYYEEKRTGVTPRWIALDNCSAGYDLLSKVSTSDDNRLIIEVKTSEEPWDRAEFYLSENEWFVLNSQKNAIIHLWSVATTPPKFGEINIPELTKQIPINTEKGKWQIVKIPFSIINSN